MIVANKFTENTVAFIDILAFKDLIDMAVEAEDPSRLIKLINKSVSKTFSSIKDFKHDSFSVKIFSDNISISTDTSPANILILFRLAAQIQLTLFEDDIRVRGAVAIGAHYENDTIIFSKALVKAYDLERKYSIYPRIIVERDVFTKFPGNDIDAFESYCLKDSDGFYIVDYLGYIIHFLKNKDAATLKTILESHKCDIERRRKAILSNSDIGKKFLWAANYHNVKVLSSSLTEEEKQDLRIDNLPTSF